jgi:hypothetical protein
MTQTRIVLNPKHRLKADEILQQTGIDNLSQLFSIFIVNFGDRLVKKLKDSEND